MHNPVFSQSSLVSAGCRKMTHALRLPWHRVISFSNSAMLALEQPHCGWTKITRVGREWSKDNLLCAGQCRGEGDCAPGVPAYRSKPNMPVTARSTQRQEIAAGHRAWRRKPRCGRGCPAGEVDVVGDTAVKSKL